MTRTDALATLSPVATAAAQWYGPAGQVEGLAMVLNGERARVAGAASRLDYLRTRRPGARWGLNRAERLAVWALLRG